MSTRLTRDTDALVTAPVLVTTNHGGHDGRAVDPATVPLPTRSTKIGEGIVSPPAFIAELRGGGSTARSAFDPLATLTASGNHHGLVTPFYLKAFGGNAKPEDMVKPITDPLGAITTKDHHWLVIPYRRGSRAHRPDTQPLSTIATRESHGLLAAAVEVKDCRFRMLQPREHLRAQRFPDSYIVTGNKGEQTMQAGNAVSSNVAHWIGAAIIRHLDAA